MFYEHNNPISTYILPVSGPIYKAMPPAGHWHSGGAQMLPMRLVYEQLSKGQRSPPDIFVTVVKF